MSTIPNMHPPWCDYAAADVLSGSLVSLDGPGLVGVVTGTGDENLSVELVVPAAAVRPVTGLDDPAVSR